MLATRASRCTSDPRHPGRIWTRRWRLDGGGWTGVSVAVAVAMVADGGGWRWWWLWQWRWRLSTMVPMAAMAIIRLTVRRRQRRYVKAGKEESGCGRAVDGGNNWNRGQKPCRAIWLADNGNTVWRRSPPWRRCFSIPLSFPYHILRVKTFLRFRTSGGGDPRRILLGGTALEKPLRARILSLVYALASNFSPRP
uniref:Uncharacterized protein n=1 Tax=Oryza barthii TaxID=65489 RepID=A0A0D3HVY9_9ORYZ